MKIRSSLQLAESVVPNLNRPHKNKVPVLRLRRISRIFFLTLTPNASEVPVSEAIAVKGRRSDWRIEQLPRHKTLL